MISLLTFTGFVVYFRATRNLKQGNDLMRPTLDLVALKARSDTVVDQRNKFLNFVSEGTPVAAFMLYALNALERATGGVLMPAEFVGEILLYRPDNRFSLADHDGQATYHFAKNDDRWGLVSVSALVKDPMRPSLVPSVLSKVLGVDIEVGEPEIMRVLKETTEGDCSEMLAIFDLMPVNSVVSLLFRTEAFADLLGVTNMDGYGRAAAQWYRQLDLTSEKFPVGVDELHLWMTSVGVKQERSALWSYIRRNTDFNVEQQILECENQYLVQHALAAGVVSLERFQKLSGRLLASRSPDFVKMLIDAGLQFSAADVENLLLHSCFSTSKEGPVAEILQLLHDAGVSLLGRSHYLGNSGEYRVPSRIKKLVGDLRKQEREKMGAAA
jgi:hypothetical protein